MKKILITGKDSYIGTSVEQYLLNKGNYAIDTLDMKDNDWKNYQFSGYDVVFHVAGIAHADTGKLTKERKALYYNVNTKLVLDTAKKAKQSGVGQFILMSSMIIYGDSAGIGENKIITENTEPKPSSVYGNSKWLADKGVQKLQDERFKVVVLRPPMIYGRNSKGNYPLLSKLAKITPIFPNIKNQRSMLYVENLCEFIKLLIDEEQSGVYFPQNREYVETKELVSCIADVKGHYLIFISVFNKIIYFVAKYNKTLGRIINKIFGNMVYEKSMSEYEKMDYRIYSLEESIRKTEERE